MAESEKDITKAEKDEVKPDEVENESAELTEEDLSGVAGGAMRPPDDGG